MSRVKSSVGVGIELDNTYKLREKLLTEIAGYEYEQSQLKINGNHVNFTLMQTYRELIASRREMLSRLPVCY